MEKQTLVNEKTNFLSKMKKVFYWICTGLLLFELLFGATWDFNWVNKGFVKGVFEHLGYPLYLGTLLGISKILAAVAIMVPRFSILKEWAYAGVFYIFAGAVYSHVANGEDTGKAIFPFIFLCITMGSWGLRATSKRI